MFAMYACGKCSNSMDATVLEEPFEDIETHSICRYWVKLKHKQRMQPDSCAFISIEITVQPFMQIEGEIRISLVQPPNGPFMLIDCQM